jgi:hypothetical protein
MVLLVLVGCFPLLKDRDTTSPDALLLFLCPSQSDPASCAFLLCSRQAPSSSRIDPRRSTSGERTRSSERPDEQRSEGGEQVPGGTGVLDEIGELTSGESVCETERRS